MTEQSKKAAENLFDAVAKEYTEPDEDEWYPVLEGKELEKVTEPLFEFTTTGIVWYREPSLEEWLEIGKGLNLMNTSLIWFWADYLNMGSGLWGEMYTQALDESGYKYSHLSNAKSVGAKIPYEVRRADVAFSVHQALAPMSQGEDDTEGQRRVSEWLDFVVEKDLTRRMLRKLSDEHRSPETVADEQISLLRGSKNRVSVGKRRDRQARKFYQAYREMKDLNRQLEEEFVSDLPF